MKKNYFLMPVINYLIETSTERGFFGRNKHQTSDYGCTSTGTLSA